MYQVRANGTTVMSGNSADEAIAKLTTELLNGHHAELWCDSRYCGQVVWNGTKFEIHWSGD